MPFILKLEIDGEVRSERIVYGSTSIHKETMKWHKLYALKAMKREYKIYYHIESKMVSTRPRIKPKKINYENFEIVGECQC